MWVPHSFILDPSLISDFLGLVMGQRWIGSQFIHYSTPACHPLHALFSAEPK